MKKLQITINDGRLNLKQRANNRWSRTKPFLRLCRNLYEVYNKILIEDDELTLLGIPEIESVIVTLDVLYSRENSEEHSIKTVG